MRLLASVLLLALHPPTQRTTILEQRRFETNASTCVFRVLETNSSEQGLTQSAEIQCGDHLLSTYPLGDGGFHNVFISVHDPIRIVLGWERGLVSGVTIFSVTGAARPRAHVSFEQMSELGTESLDDATILLVHVRPRFARGEKLPEGTNLYRWKDGGYIFVESFKWHENTTWADRYCILANPMSCPADRSNKRLLDEYEKP